MRNLDETRLMEILVTHNEPVLCEDLACALGISRGGVQQRAIRLQTLGYVVVDEDNDTVASTSAADTALRSRPG
jgi:Mn-dependent DtxR family transcriptional regulator